MESTEPCLLFHQKARSPCTFSQRGGLVPVYPLHLAEAFTWSPNAYGDFFMKKSRFCVAKPRQGPTSRTPLSSGHAESFGTFLFRRRSSSVSAERMLSFRALGKMRLSEEAVAIYHFFFLLSESSFPPPVLREIHVAFCSLSAIASPAELGPF